MSEALRLMVYDATCRGKPWRVGLTHSWMAGRLIYCGLGILDAGFGARSWDEALEWLATYQAHRPIKEIQFWGHGKWGRVLINKQSLDTSALNEASRHNYNLRQIRARMVGVESLWWFRTCETFGAISGQDFANKWTNFFQCRTAGHTHIIGPLQSGLYVLRPDQKPYWSPSEGIAVGTADNPVRALCFMVEMDNAAYNHMFSRQYTATFSAVIERVTHRQRLRRYQR